MRKIICIMLVLFFATVGLFAGGQKAEKAGERVLRIAVDTFFSERLIPQAANISGGMVDCMYDLAFALDDKGQLAPWIVKSWEWAPDKLSWIYHIRDDVFFHDGSKCTAKDVAFSQELAASDVSINGSKWQSWLQMAGGKPRIEIIDEYTLRIYTNGPQPLVPDMSTRHVPHLHILPKDYIEKHGLDYFEQHPIGTGPYKMVRQVPGDLREFEAVENHWTGKVPDFKRVIMYLVPEESTRVYMLEKDEIDVIGTISMDRAFAMRDKGFKLIGGGTTGIIYLFIHGTYDPLAAKMPLRDVRVRQALSLAINRKELLDVLLHGEGTFPTLPAATYYSPDMTPKLIKKWEAWAKKNYRYDPKEAKRLVEQAGYKDGFAFDLWSVPDANAPFMEDMITACAGYFKEIGARATIIQRDNAAWKAVRLTSQKKDLVGVMTPLGTMSIKPSTIQRQGYFISEGGTLNLLAPGSPDQAEMDALYAEGMSCLDMARREKILDRMIEISTSSWTAMTVLEAPSFRVFGPRVDGQFRPQDEGIAQVIQDLKYTGVEPKKR